MRFVVFTHSLISDWNHGNAHFLRGVASELVARGYDLRIFEPKDGWSRQNLIASYGPEVVSDFERAYPQLRSTLYDVDTIDLERALDKADVVMVHEWNPPDLIARIGQHRAAHKSYSLFFHDSYHRSVTAPASIRACDLQHYDGVLACGGVIRDLYRHNQWARAAWIWHEAADTRVFRPIQAQQRAGDLVWIGNWGDDERAQELREFLIEPVKRLRLRARVYGVRYPEQALKEFEAAGIEYAGWLPNYRVPEIFAQYRVTIHVPRRPYARALSGIPTIRPFEALACGIPLISAPWHDCEELFRPDDFLTARDGWDMEALLSAVLSSPAIARQLSANGLETIRNRHTCAHRVDELLNISQRLNRRVVVQGAT